MMSARGGLMFGQAGAALRRFAGTMLRPALRFALPPLCLSCRVPVEDTDTLCPACWSTAGFIERPYCLRTGIPLAVDLPGEEMLWPAGDAPPNFSRSRAALDYGDTTGRLIARFKYGDRPDLARPFARWMVRVGEDLFPGCDLIVPVPLHWTRLWTRRFNQSALLAKGIAGATGLPLRTDVLRRVRRTPRQAGLGRKDRLGNVAGAFTVPDAARAGVAGKRVLLVDDVLTTGATGDAAAAALRRAGARDVDLLVLALARRDPALM
jgi:ComF family protein